MNALSIRILSLALFAGLCATATYWVVTLSAREAPLPAAAARLPIRTEDAAALFGGQLDKNPVQDIHLFGILALNHGGAAIVGVGGEPPRAVSLGAEVTPGAKLAEVRSRSIIVDRNGARAEIQLPANTPSPAIYMR
ncbi:MULTISPECIES: type II secretion system protein N [Burkholderia]|uniref:General secretion pathway protein GspC n=1 Tax=Burkholderia diffusa TaxID=488732 RepID=A0A6P2M055_9BURK|nr:MULTISPECIES: type II secretion system protein N [Burkholderia]AOI96576.1 general secretion pathway protein GspC [Burkholderia sp. LA-2-3-30-S1-D2]KAB0654209.1 general secretion pathway protein GspC [Burkholderia diffusa]KVE15897.1 general secretion pathway protein GspC [Burkholderia sp. LA-2-3-30-S1-D2]MBM2652851.1 general secretion pathway protein GspC [Burkholderia diffusa]MCA8205672.1 general secretion pathway protein GspC [Burkholderia sp. AU33545]